MGPSKCGVLLNWRAPVYNVNYHVFFLAFVSVISLPAEGDKSLRGPGKPEVGWPQLSLHNSLGSCNKQDVLTENGVHLRKTGLIFILTNIALNYDLITEGFVTLCNSAPYRTLHSLYPNRRDTVSFPSGSAQFSNFGLYQKLLEDLLKLTAEPTPRFCPRGPEEGAWKLCVLLLFFRFDFVLLCCGTGAQTMVLRMCYSPRLITCVSDKCVQWC